MLKSTLFSWFLLFGFFEPLLAQKAAPEMIAIEHGHLITMIDKSVLANHTVLVQDGTITALGPDGTVAIPEGTKRVDARGGYLVPGLTDGHVHIGDKTELLSYLRYGVTTVFNLGGDAVDLFSGNRLEILPLKREIRQGKVIGPVILTTGQALDGDPATGPFQRALGSVEEAKQAVLEQKRAGYDFIKVYDSLSPELHQAIVTTAKTHGLAVIGHIPEQGGVMQTLSSGQDVIAHAEEFYAAFEDQKDVQSVIQRLAKQMATSKVYVIPNSAFIRELIHQLENLPEVLQHPDVRFLAPSVRVWWEPRYNYYTNRDNLPAFLKQCKTKYAWLLPLIKEMQGQGVKLLMGTDASIPAALPGLAIHREMEDLVTAGLTPYEAIRTATANMTHFAAAHLAREVPFGTIAVGHRADILILEKNPLEKIAHLQTIRSVMARGVLYKPATLKQMLQEQTATFANQQQQP